MTTALEGGEGVNATPWLLFTPGERPGTHCTVGWVGRSGQVGKISPSPGFDPRTVQPVANRYTDYPTRPTPPEMLPQYLHNAVNLQNIGHSSKSTKLISCPHFLFPIQSASRNSTTFTHTCHEALLHGLTWYIFTSWAWTQRRPENNAIMPYMLLTFRRNIQEEEEEVDKDEVLD